MVIPSALHGILPFLAASSMYYPIFIPSICPLFITTSNKRWVLLQNVGFAPNSDYSPTIPHLGYMLFEMMFAVYMALTPSNLLTQFFTISQIITPAIISGAVAERITFKAWLIFVIAWSTFVYDPLGRHTLFLLFFYFYIC